jgi:hypothetical protein
MSRRECSFKWKIVIKNFEAVQKNIFKYYVFIQPFMVNIIKTAFDKEQPMGQSVTRKHQGQIRK